MEQLSLDHGLGQADVDLQDPEVPLIESDLESLHVKPVAGQHRGVVAPQHVGRRPSTADLGDIDDVVVNQRGRVDHLDYGRQADGGLAPVADELGGKQQQGGPKTLSATLVQVAPNGCDGARRGDRPRADLAVDLLELFPHEL